MTEKLSDAEQILLKHGIDKPEFFFEKGWLISSKIVIAEKSQSFFQQDYDQLKSILKHTKYTMPDMVYGPFKLEFI